jgi:O-antigen/teichoic acid export membrane protein
MGAYRIPTGIIGNYNVANTFVVLITFVAQPITTMLFPAFSKLDPTTDHETMKNVFQFSVKYAALIVVPVTALVMTLSGPGVSALFGDKYPSTPLFLALLAISYLFTPFGSLTTGNFLNSQGKTTLTLKLTVLAVAIGLPLGFALIPLFGVLGLITASLSCGLPGLYISLRWIQKHYDLTVDWISSAKILFCSGVAAGITYALLSQLGLTIWIALIVGVLVFVPVIVCTILLTRTVDRSDIANLRGMLSGLGPLRGFFSFFLNLVEKIMDILRV